MKIIRKSQLLISSDQPEFQSFDGLARHRSNVLPVNLDQIIEHCSTPTDLEHHHLQQERVMLDGTIIISVFIIVFIDI